MYVSIYEAELDKLTSVSFAHDEDMPPVFAKIKDRLSGILKKEMEEAYSDMEETLRRYLQSNLEDNIKSAAAELTVRLLKTALAGDRETFKDLFEFNHDWQGWLPRSWPEHWALPIGVRLRVKLLERHRDLFESKVIKDLEGVIEMLKAHKGYAKDWRPMVEGDL